VADVDRVPVGDSDLLGDDVVDLVGVGAGEDPADSDAAQAQNVRVAGDYAGLVIGAVRLVFGVGQDVDPVDGCVGAGEDPADSDAAQAQNVRVVDAAVLGVGGVDLDENLDGVYEFAPALLVVLVVDKLHFVRSQPVNYLSLEMETL